MELGATWLHGIEGHPVYELALEKGLVAVAEKQQSSECSHAHSPVPRHTMLKAIQPCIIALAESQWGASRYVREGAAHVVTSEELKAASKISTVFRDAVLAAQEPNNATMDPSVGQYLRRVWHQVHVDLHPVCIWHCATFLCYP